MMFLTLLMTIGWLALAGVVGWVIMGLWITYCWKG